MDTLTLVSGIAGAAFLGILAAGLLFARTYRRASKETAFVRTGSGGQRVVMNGGAMVLPVLHEMIPVNMNTLRLEVSRAQEAALITKDRMRVDVLAEFYVRVKTESDSIARAAQTLGHRTMEPRALKELVEGKFVDALRAVAAKMDMEELHEQRGLFVRTVQENVQEDLLQNGLELESVSLTGLDQTERKFFNPNNAFDAEGLTRLTEQIETRRKQRNDIEQDTQVQIQAKNLEAERERLSLSRDEAYAQMEQEREVQVRKAAQAAEIAQEQAEKHQEAEEARISAKQKVDLANLVAHRSVEEERIQNDQKVQSHDIERQRLIEMAEVNRKKAVELAEQERAIAVAEQSKAESEAKAIADEAKAKAVQAEEAIVTVRETERAMRKKAVEVVRAMETAETDATLVTVAAEAKRKAAEDEAAALRTLAEAHGAEALIAAKAEADSVLAKANAEERRYEVEAAGRQALNEAANLLSSSQISMQLKLALVEGLPSIIRESVKPMENIDAIKIMHVDGLGGGGGSGGGGVSEGGAGGSLADQVVNSALQYRAQAPLVDALLKEVGLDGAETKLPTSLLEVAAAAAPEG